MESFWIRYGIETSILVFRWELLLLPFSVVQLFNTMRNRTIRGLRLVLTACLVWTGSVSLMRLGIFPGVSFWHNFALLGLLSIPVFMYVFLFGFLEITEHDA